MSCGNLMHSAAIRGCIVVALLASLPIPVLAQPKSDNPRGQTRADKAQNKPNDDATPMALKAIQDEINRISRALEAQIDKPETADEKDRAERDLAAQEHMANWARLMFWVAVFANVLTAAGIALIALTLKHTRKAALASAEMVVTSRDMVVEGERATQAALGAAREAKRQADLFEESFKRLERPYIFPGALSDILSGGESTQYNDTP